MDGQFVAGGDRRDDRLVLQHVQGDARRAVPAHADDRGVEPAGAQALDEPVGRVLGQGDLDRRVGVVEARQQRGQVGVVRGHRADGDSPPEQSGHLVDDEPGALHGGERGARVRQEGSADLGRDDGPPGAVEQLLAELAFQLADLGADPGLGHPHLLGGPGEVPLLHHRHEVLELTQFHNC